MDLKADLVLGAGLELGAGSALKADSDLGAGSDLGADLVLGACLDPTVEQVLRAVLTREPSLANLYKTGPQDRVSVETECPVTG